MILLMESSDLRFLSGEASHNSNSILADLDQALAAI